MHLVIRHLAIFIMFRDGKGSEQALLGWSMLDHDDSVNDIYDFDEYSTSSRRLPEGAHTDVVHAPQSAGVHFLGKTKRDLQTCTVSASRLSEARAEPTGEPATPRKLATDMRNLVPNTLASASWNTGVEVHTCRSCFVKDRTQTSSMCGRSARRRRKTCNFQGNQCVIDESSSDDSVEDSSHNHDRATRARVAIEEIAEDEIKRSADAEPTKLQPSRFRNMGTESPISRSPIQPASNACDAQFSSIECPTPRQTALKNGFEERLLVSRQKESADLTLWKFYKKNANFPKTFSRDAPKTVTVRILTLEDVYGIAYCACEVDSLTYEISNVCLALPLELAEREKLDRGAVVRIYPPWREYTLLTYPEKVISGVQCFEVLERH